MNVVKLVSIDPGKFGTKAKCRDKKFYARSLVDTVENVPTSNGHRVRFFNKEYIIGDESIPCDYDYDKQKLETKILVNLAISKLVDPGDKVNLVVGMPVEHWLDRERRAAYECFMTSVSQMQLVEADREIMMNFRILKCVAVPETIGHIASNSKYKNRTVGIIDCGGCNIQGAIYKNGLPIKDSCFTLNEGGNFYLNAVKKAINSKFGLNYQDYQVQDLIQFGSNHGRREEIIIEITRVTKLHFSKVIRECKARNWNLEDMPIIIVGGASNYFKEIILELLPNATFSDNEVWDNVEGFDVIGEALYDMQK